MNLPDLLEGFLGDGQRLHHHGDIPQGLRHFAEERFFIDHVLGHEAVHFLDATFDEVAGRAEVRALGAARLAVGLRAGPAHHGDDEIAFTQRADAVADFGNFTEPLMAEHKMLETVGGRAVVEAADLAVGAADAHFEHAELHLDGAGQLRQWMADLADFFATGIDGNGVH